MCDRWQACSECYAGPGGALLTQLLAGCLDKKETTGCQAESGSKDSWGHQPAHAQSRVGGPLIET